MPKFKHPETGNVIEVSEEHAEAVIRVQGVYVEVVEDEPEAEAKRGPGRPKKQAEE